MKAIAFFNNNAGVDRTSLVYHLAWMYADLGAPVVVADLDPQAALTSMFLDDDRIEELWPDAEHSSTVYGAVQPLLEGTGDISTPHVEDIADNIGLLVGDLALAAAEDELNSQWPDCLDRKPRAFRVISAFWRVIQQAAEAREARLVLIDVGPNLGAINRAALIAAEHVVIPLAPDLYSLQGLRTLGPTLVRWRDQWAERRARNPAHDLEIPFGAMRPAGYVVMQHGMRENRPPKAYQRWIDRFPAEYRESVLDESSGAAMIAATDPFCLAMLKHYRSLMPMAMEARKPVFFLKPADGAIGAHSQAARNAYTDFFELAQRIADRSGVVLS
jgi:cellulose biosynthesis protein BcsQ